MTYRSTTLIERPRGDWTVLGELTIRGVTRPVALAARFEGSRTCSGIAALRLTSSGSAMLAEAVRWHRRVCVARRKLCRRLGAPFAATLVGTSKTATRRIKSATNTLRRNSRTGFGHQ